MVYPGAYVDLNHEQVQMLTAIRQLRYRSITGISDLEALCLSSRIYCAGVFHNIILVAMAILFLFVHPFFLRRFYMETASVYRVSKVLSPV